jgi:hypothetical protein
MKPHFSDPEARTIPDRPAVLRFFPSRDAAIALIASRASHA